MVLAATNFNWDHYTTRYFQVNLMLLICFIIHVRVYMIRYYFFISIHATAIILLTEFIFCTPSQLYVYYLVIITTFDTITTIFFQVSNVQLKSNTYTYMPELLLVVA